MTRSRSKANRRTRSRRKLIIILSLVFVIAISSPFWSKYLVQLVFDEVLSEGDSFKIDYVQVTGTKVVPADSIRALANIHTGTGIFDLPLSVVEQRVCKHPWILRASACRRLPNCIEISVVEREPAAAIQNSTFFVVSADSMALIPPSKDWIWNLPILTPPRSVVLKNGEPIKDKATLALLREVLIAVRVQKDLRENLSEMYYRNGNIHAALSSPAIELNLGKGVSDLSWIGLRDYLATHPLPNNEMKSAYIDLHIAGKLIVKPATYTNEESAKG